MQYSNTVLLPWQNSFIISTLTHPPLSLRAHTQALESNISAHQSSLSSLTTLGHSMMDNASLEDSVIVGDRLAQITAAFEALQRNAATRRRALEYGLAQASGGKTFEIQSVLGIGLISRPLPLETCLVPGYLRSYLTAMEKN